MRVHLDEVARVALALQANGRLVTTRLVRQELGYGSYSTISRFLAELGLRALEEGAGPSLCAAIRLQATALVRGVWRAAEHANEERTKAAELQWRLRLSNVVKQWEMEKEARCAQDKLLAVVHDEQERWRAERKVLKQKINALTKQLRRTTGELDAHRHSHVDRTLSPAGLRRMASSKGDRNDGKWP